MEERTRTGDMEAMRKAVQVADTFADVLREYTRSDKKFNTVCREHGVDSYFARRVLQSEAFLKLTGTMQELELPTLPSEGTEMEQLYSDVFGIPVNEVTHTELPEDLKETVEYCLQTLTEREQRIMTSYYGLNGETAKTYREIGQDFNVTQERIRQVHAKALRKLRHPNRANILKVGKKVYDEQCAESERVKAIYAEAKAEELERLKAEDDERIRQLAIDDAQRKHKDSGGLFVIPIENLDLSVRAFNCLHRAGIETVGDLLKLDDEALLRIRNLGRKSAEEVKQRIEELKKERGAV